ncbi:helix-turn-helix domain-containing protein [Aquimarina rhabdastrellae]
MKGKFIMMRTKAFHKLIEEVTQKILVEIKPIIDARKQSDEEEWLNPKEAKDALRIKSTGKLLRLRNEGFIKYAKHGNITVYSKKSIMEFLEKCIVN